MESAEYREENECIELEVETPQVEPKKRTEVDALGNEGRIISLPEAARMLGTSYPTVSARASSPSSTAYELS